MNRLTIGTRGSKLALWQAHHVADRLRDAHPGLEVAVKAIKTKGDALPDVALSKIGGFSRRSLSRRFSTAAWTCAFTR